MTTLLNQDDLNNIQVAEAANASMALLLVLQDMPAHTQVASIASMFLLIMERYGFNPQDAFSVINNIMNHAEGRRPEFKAIAQFMREEL